MTSKVPVNTQFSGVLGFMGHGDWGGRGSKANYLSLRLGQNEPKRKLITILVCSSIFSVILVILVMPAGKKSPNILHHTIWEVDHTCTGIINKVLVRGAESSDSSCAHNRIKKVLSLKDVGGPLQLSIYIVNNDLKPRGYINPLFTGSFCSLLSIYINRKTNIWHFYLGDWIRNYRLRSEWDNALGSVCLSICVCVSVCLCELSCLNCLNFDIHYRSLE